MSVPEFRQNTQISLCFDKLNAFNEDSRQQSCSRLKREETLTVCGLTARERNKDKNEHMEKTEEHRKIKGLGFERDQMSPFLSPQAHLRSVDVKILQQLLAVHEGIEAVKWLLEERSTLTSRCSSLTSSQYSLGEGPDTSWRGSWSSLQDPNDKLDNISIGSYLDTLADDMDEYCPSSSESVISAGTGPNVGVRSGTGAGNGQDTPVWTKAPETDKGTIKANGVLEKPATQTGSPTRSSLSEKLGTNQSPKLKPYKNGKIDLDTCKMNGKMHLEYDAHWRWVQSQEDVTFL
uniref:Leucine rich adaptor protein 1 n=1 Tax=Acanthochromis polyacanthus TaxID=80966 RepID=A0A3Q1GL46_9TELE